MARVRNPAATGAARGSWRDRLAARRVGLSRPPAGLSGTPEPLARGSVARGERLLAGEFLFAGFHVEAPGTAPWDLPVPEPAFAEALHAFGWLDDLAALGGGEARDRAWRWSWAWAARYGRGGGPGWTPALTGRRLLRCLEQAPFLLTGQGRVARTAFIRALARQALFLARRWRGAPAGAARFEVLAALLQAGLWLDGLDRLVAPAMRSLARECAGRIDSEGAIASRNPEAAMEILALLTTTARALTATGRIVTAAHREAIDRMVPALRVLRHADGTLARFHGGGRGIPGRLDGALAASGVRRRSPGGAAMGFARLSAGRSSVLVDAAAPPAGAAAGEAHASTLAFELTSGRRPVIVSCGAGAVFGAEWRRAGRATPAHSTLTLSGLSSSRIGAGPAGGRPGCEPLTEAPRSVAGERRMTAAGPILALSHDGYRPGYGLLHHRRLELSRDGTRLAGRDRLIAQSKGDRASFDRATRHAELTGIEYAVRFHLHPDISAVLDTRSDTVTLHLPSGEVWVFGHDGGADLWVEPSVYLDSTRPAPRETQQIVLTARAMPYADSVIWQLARDAAPARATRDFARDDQLLPDTWTGEGEE